MKGSFDFDRYSVVRISRQGGLAAIKALSRPRLLRLSDGDEALRQRLGEMLERCAQESSEDAGRSDQRYFRIELRGASERADDETVLDVPEERAPEVLLRWWRGEEP
ncbi:protealysin inhibitor emfourin [Halotalea alkalilenta]|uniref:Uncharacterized protein n=1 Tax=Halotalea alkalilenta TaxID=376489 RepID=A0A172YD77_9GAMM|nr:protealysin inhibitor emfourin [Halotalea alkalilenta]ANF57173.1 hypothetical protein A5892_06595 [Halotalea alkalilenta]